MGPIDLPSGRDWMIFFGIAAGAVAGATVAIDRGVNALVEDKQEFRARAKDAVEGKSLTLIALDKFQKSRACGDGNRPYTATFAAKGSDGKLVEGMVCIARDREARLKINP